MCKTRALLRAAFVPTLALACWLDATLPAQAEPLESPLELMYAPDAMIVAGQADRDQSERPHRDPAKGSALRARIGRRTRSMCACLPTCRRPQNRRALRDRVFDVSARYAQAGGYGGESGRRDRAGESRHRARRIPRYAATARHPEGRALGRRPRVAPAPRSLARGAGGRRPAAREPRRRRARLRARTRRSACATRIARSSRRPCATRTRLYICKPCCWKAPRENPRTLGGWWRAFALQIVTTTPVDGYSDKASDPVALILTAFEVLDRYAVKVPPDALKRWVWNPNPPLVERVCVMLRRESPEQERSTIQLALADPKLPGSDPQVPQRSSAPSRSDQ